jgi:magnesium-transporting ATPase (P-type)
MWLTTSEASFLGVEEVAGRLQVDNRTGLWWEEANHRKQLFGHNELSRNEEEPTWKKYIEQVMIWIASVNKLFYKKFINILIFHSLKIH